MHRSLREREAVNYRERSPSQDSIRLEPAPGLKRLENRLNYETYKCLKFSRKLIKSFRFNIEISSKVFDYLKNHYKLDYRFKRSREFIEDFDFVKERISERNVRNKTKINMDFFFVRIFKKGDLMINDKLYKGSHYVAFKFIVREIVIH